MGDNKTYSLSVNFTHLLASYSEESVYILTLYMQYYYYYYTDVGFEPDLPQFIYDTVDLSDEYSDDYSMEAGYRALINEISTAWFDVKLTAEFEQVQHYIDYTDIELVDVDTILGVSIILYRPVVN